jgi:GNAT superfamily N-acetyltransferase
MIRTADWDDLAALRRADPRPDAGERMLAGRLRALVHGAPGEEPAGVALIDERRTGLAEIAVRVEPAQRRRGLGRALLEATIADARAQGIRKLSGECGRCDRAAPALAAACGFAVEALMRAHRPGPRGELEDVLALGLVL